MSNVVTFNMEIEEEADTSFRFNYNNNSTGLPMDLTGYRAEMQVRKNYSGDGQTDPVLVFTSDANGGIILGGISGTIDIFISYEDTMKQLWNHGVYTIVLISPHGGRAPFVKGFLTINRSSTKLESTGLLNIAGTTPTHPNNLGKGGLDSVP